MRAAPSVEAFAPAEWAEAAHFPRMRQHEAGETAEPRRAESWFGATEDAFYFAVSSELPPVGGLWNEKGNQVDVATTDACEFFISSDAGAAKGVIYQIIVAPDGRVLAQAHERGGAHAAENWENEVKARSYQADGSWHVLCEVKRALFGKPLAGTAWGVSCCRDWKSPWRFACAPGDFMGRDVRVRFAAGVPAVGFDFSVPPHIQKTIKGALRLANPGDAALACDVRLTTTTDAMPKMELVKSVTVEPGAVATVPYEAPNLNNCTEYRTEIAVSAGGREVYRYPLLWKAPFDKPIWTVSAEEVKPFDFDFAYYPTRNALRVVQSVNVSAEKAPKEVSYTVAEKKTGKTVKTFACAAEDGRETLATLPPLDGDYTITLDAGGAKTVKEFERHHFDWEGNTLGKSRKIYPPFTPIKVAGGAEPKLGVLLREHALGGTGLPKGIVAKGREILAGEMRLVANGEAAEGTLKVASKAPDVVVTESEISAPGFSAASSARWEYDGCLRYVLTLNPGHIDSLVLEVPLKAEHAGMIHALGRMRDSVSKTLPKEDGKVWDARKVRQLLCDGFAPYVLLGDGHRGLAFWAENDKGWSWDRKTSNVEIWREKGVLTMKIFLVNKPVDVKKARHITLGFMAAPVKPRPADWLTRREDWNVAFLATDVQWFAEGDCGSAAPIGKNLALWDWIRRCYDAKEPVPDLADAEPLKKYIDDYMQIYASYEGGWRKGFYKNMFRHHRDQGSSKTSGRPVTPLLYYNRSVWNNLEEYKTFMNEWSLRDFPARGTPPKQGEIMISPADGTYLDYVVWWYRKSFEYGNRGVYCDNYFNVLTYNRAHPAVYKDEKGEIVPANVIWALRDQAKRVRQMMCEEGMVPFFWPHMTSTMILPAMSFADGQLDWEWKYGEGPVQTRFPEEYLQMATDGEMAGVIPWVLWDQHGSSGEPLVKRSFSGVMMLYGLGAQNGSYPEFREKIRKPYLKAKGVRFENFATEGRRALGFKTKDVRWSLLSIPGERATAVVVNWTDRPVQAEGRVDLKALGLDGAKATDFDTNAAVPLAADGAFSVALEGWGVKVVEFAKEAE